MSKLYLESGRIVDAVIRDRVGLKAALYRDTLVSDMRVVCKLCAATLGHRTVLQAAVAKAGLKLEGNSGSDSDVYAFAGRRGLALVMAYDLLIGRGIRGGGHLKRALVSRQPQLQAALSAAKEDAGDSVPGGAFADLPRYVRINRLRLVDDSSVDVARRELESVLGSRVQQARSSGNKKASRVIPGDVGELGKVVSDAILPNVLVLDSRTRPFLHGLPAIEKGSLVLQDRSSCLAALAAGLREGDRVLDACAAPGSKTAHALELLGGRGRLIACERDPQRAVSLVSRLRSLGGIRRERNAFGSTTKKTKKKKKEGLVAEGVDGSQADEDWFVALEKAPPLPGTTLRFHAPSSSADGVSVEVRVGDFLDCDPKKAPFRDVEVLIVDPSCSGSGLPDHHLGPAPPMGQQRLRRLAAFQKRILRHALSFPGARTVCYSTCSTHQEENEDVIAAVLGEEPRLPFVVAEALPSWHRCPPPSAGAAPLPAWVSRCVRCLPEVHRCRGFFLCRLDRVADGALMPDPPTPLPSLGAGRPGKHRRSEDASDAVVPDEKRRKRRRKKKDGSDVDGGDAQGKVLVAALKQPETRKNKARGIRIGRPHPAKV